MIIIEVNNYHLSNHVRGQIMIFVKVIKKARKLAVLRDFKTSNQENNNRIKLSFNYLLNT